MLINGQAWLAGAVTRSLQGERVTTFTHGLQLEIIGWRKSCSFLSDWFYGWGQNLFNHTAPELGSQWVHIYSDCICSSSYLLRTISFMFNLPCYSWTRACKQKQYAAARRLETWLSVWRTPLFIELQLINSRLALNPNGPVGIKVKINCKATRIISLRCSRLPHLLRSSSVLLVLLSSREVKGGGGGCLFSHQLDFIHNSWRFI